MPDGAVTSLSAGLAHPDVSPTPRRLIVDAILSAPQRLHLLCTPAGYGKTCLLDEIENRLAQSNTVLRLEPDLNAQQLDAASQGDVILIDDANDARLLDAVMRLTSADEGPRVIMAARARPAIQTAQMQLQESLRIWTHLDLRCDAEDVLALLKTIREPEAPRTVCHEIAQKAEGWIAGAKFLALQWAASRRSNRSVDVATSLEAYFNETILRPLPEPQRQRLLLASISDELCVPLFEHITGGTDLPAIAEAGALLFPSPDREGWWRFHRMFRKHLARSAQTLGLDELERAHRAAAEWRLAAGTPTEAAAHALECGDTRFAAEVIDKGARAFIANGQISEALAWLDRLPVVEHDGRPRIRLFYVTALAAAGRLEEADRANEEVLSLLNDTDGQAKRADEIAAHTRFHRELIDFHRCPDDIDLRRIDALLEDTFRQQRTVYGEALLLKGAILHRQGDFAGARAAILDSMAHLEASSSWYALIVGQMVLAQIDYDGGDFIQTEDRCTALVKDLAQWTNMRIPAIAPAVIILARLAYARNNLENAARWLSEAAELLPALQSPEWEFEHRLLETRLACAQGDWESGLHLSEALHGLAHRLRRPVTTARAHAIVIDIQSALGAAEAAQQRLEDAHTALQNAPAKSFWLKRAQLVAMLAEHRLALANGDEENLIAKTYDTLGLARRSESAPMLLQALLLHATALHSGGEDAKAFRTLREAFKLGEKSRNMRAFLDFHHASFQQLLSAYRSKRSAQDITDDAWLVDADRPNADRFDETPAQRKAFACNARVAATTDLTPKELEVLQLAAEGRNNQGIAEELFISVATVKWHIGNILSKLHASNRSAAIARARQLRLLA
ncbi:LuxR C-terminal-related transcriptional regulator [Hyphococcus sp.]|uniref:LuxR C-terminal-related transcriptional regulator n=1 Tax=Hyphococcus sp. TaxID=2038636 RepID=UPI0035C6F3FA